MGHAYGARHAALWQTSDGNPVSATGELVEYGDTYDQMGGATGYSQPYIDFNPWVKWHFGWIDDAQVAIVTGPGHINSGFSGSTARLLPDCYLSRFRAATGAIIGSGFVVIG